MLRTGPTACLNRECYVYVLTADERERRSRQARQSEEHLKLRQDGAKELPTQRSDLNARWADLYTLLHLPKCNLGGVLLVREDQTLEVRQIGHVQQVIKPDPERMRGQFRVEARRFAVFQFTLSQALTS